MSAFYEIVSSRNLLYFDSFYFILFYFHFESFFNVCRRSSSARGLSATRRAPSFSVSHNSSQHNVPPVGANYPVLLAAVRNSAVGQSASKLPGISSRRKSRGMVHDNSSKDMNRSGSVAHLFDMSRDDRSLSEDNSDSGFVRNTLASDNNHSKSDYLGGKQDLKITHRRASSKIITPDKM